MKLVLDTNVVVSAALGNAEDLALIARIEGGQGLVWYASADMLDEYAGALARLVPDRAEAWTARIARAVTKIAGAPGVAFSPDPTDAKFIACALAAGADCIVTKDKVLSKYVGRLYGIRALDPAKIG